MSKRLIPVLNIMAKPLRSTSLPTIEDVLSAIVQHKTEFSESKFSDAVKAVINEVISLWCTNSLPTVTKTRVKQIVNNRWNEYKRLDLVEKMRQTQASYIEKVAQFKVSLTRIYVNINKY